MKKMQQGFTLIELMIVVAIIGILAAVAIPAYSDYTLRARVTEGVGMAAAAKAGVSEFRLSGTVYPTDNTAAGLPPPTLITGNNVRQVDVTNGVVAITFRGPNEITGDTLTFTPSFTGGAVTWTCTAAGGLEMRYRPSNCRA